MHPSPKRRTKKKRYAIIFKKFVVAILVGAPVVMASVPRGNEIANDTAIYQNLHELKIQKVKNISFDGDIKSLSAQEKSHHESLSTRLSGPMSRIQKTPYRPKSRH